MAKLSWSALNSRKYKSKSTRLGGGGRFQMLVDELVENGFSEESARNIAASVGRKKYGTKRFASLSARAIRRSK